MKTYLLTHIMRGEERRDDGEKWGDHAAAGNMLSWRRLACREAAVGTEAYLMLFSEGPNISLKALHFGSAATPMSR